ncbi:MAG: hypothetical protein K5756_05315 [Clostridiales bacterium]|nr:hypothetical protein [Clostridiales bacterium]
MTTASIVRSIVEFAVGALLIVGFIYERKFIAFEEKMARIIAIVRRELRADKQEHISAEQRRELEHRQRQQILDSKCSNPTRSTRGYSGSGVYRSSVSSSNSRVA